MKIRVIVYADPIYPEPVAIAVTELHETGFSMSIDRFFPNPPNTNVKVLADQIVEVETKE